MYNVVCCRNMSLDRDYAVGEVIEEELPAELLRRLLNTTEIRFTHDPKAPKTEPTWLKAEQGKRKKTRKRA